MTYIEFSRSFPLVSACLWFSAGVITATVVVGIIGCCIMQKMCLESQKQSCSRLFSGKANLWWIRFFE